MKKRKLKVGQKSRPIITKIDLDILEYIKERDDLGVMKLKDLVNINHQNIKSHLDRLQEFSLIKKERASENRQMLSLTTNGERLLEILK